MGRSSVEKNIEHFKQGMERQQRNVAAEKGKRPTETEILKYTHL